MTIKDYLGVVRQRLLVVVIAIALTTGSALVLTLRQSPEYSATSRLLVQTIVPAGEEISKYRVQKSVATEAEIVKSTVIAERVIKKLNLNRPPFLFTVDDLIERVTITQKIYTEVLEVQVTAPNPKLAAALANAFPEEYIELRRSNAVENAQEASKRLAKSIDNLYRKIQEIDGLLEAEEDPESSRAQVLKRSRDQLSGEAASLEGTRQKIVDESSLADGVGEIIDYAEPKSQRSNGDLGRTAILGFIIGLPLAIGLALLLDAMSDTIKTKEEAERLLGTEALGMIPLTPEWRGNKPYMVTLEAPYSAAAEAFRTLRINLDSKLPHSNTESRKILFTSPGFAEGKTTTAANLGVAFSESGRSALLVSADLRRPRMHQMFGIEAAPGLSDLLKGDAESHNIVQEPSPNLYVMPSGGLEDRPDQLLAGVDFRSVLADINVAQAPGRRPRPRNDENGKPVTNGDSPKSSRRTVVVAQPNVTIVDAPSVLGAAEVSALASAVDGVVLVLHAGMTRREAGARAAEQIRRAGGKILGVVLVGVKVDNDYSLYPSADDLDDDRSDSTWSKVVSGLRS